LTGNENNITTTLNTWHFKLINLKVYMLYVDWALVSCSIFYAFLLDFITFPCCQNPSHDHWPGFVSMPLPHGQLSCHCPMSLK